MAPVPSLAILRKWPRCSALVPLVLSLLVQLYRRWLQRRRQRTGPQKILHAARDKAVNESLQNNRYSPPALPPRPGVDEDERFQAINDDPRYFEGATIGKTQLAALGKKFESGTNTVSFDPVSTLVRPSMRLLHGSSVLSADSCVAVKTLKPDDVVLLPDFLCDEGQQHMYDSLVSDICALEDGSCDLSKSQTYQQVLGQVCDSFAMDSQDSEFKVCLTWYRHYGDQNPFCTAAASESDCACTVTVTFGAPCEFVFRRREFDDKICFSSNNGSLLLLCHAVCDRWKREVNLSEGMGKAGLILITISGRTAIVADETKLAPTPPLTSSPLKEGGLVDPIASAGRPSMRVRVESEPGRLHQISHDDVIMIPNFLCEQENWNIYYRLLQEVRDSQAREDPNTKWESWHEGSHLLTKNPNGSDTYQYVLDKICDCFAIANKDCRDGNSVGTRFNWYRDGSDWKPFHHDSAAFNAQRASKQNCTVGISFGAPRELAFRHAKSGELLYVPQTNGMLFFFGRDVNIRWQHGINALPNDEQDGKGRISIILWGLTQLAFEESGSPSMLADSFDGKGKGKGKGKGFANKTQGAEICRNFQRSGNCSFGDRCRYVHVTPTGYSGRRHGGA